MQKIKVMCGLLAVFISLPIGFYLMYQVLLAINANELTWFLYWVYIPVNIFVVAVGRFLDSGN